MENDLDRSKTKPNWVRKWLAARVGGLTIHHGQWFSEEGKDGTTAKARPSMKANRSCACTKDRRACWGERWALGRKTSPQLTLKKRRLLSGRNGPSDNSGRPH